MKNKDFRRGVLLKKGITSETLIREFVSGMPLKDIAKKYNRTGGRISQIIRRVCDQKQFEQYKKQYREYKEANKLNKFMVYAKELERVPVLKEAKSCIPGIINEYYKFKKIAKNAGFIYTTVTNKGRRRKHTPEKLLSHIQELALKLGYTPSGSEIYTKGLYSHNMYVSCFGSLRNAQKLAGLEPNTKYNSIANARRRSNYITIEQCVEDIKRLHVELGGPPSLAQLKEHGKYPFSMYYIRLGGLKKIRELPEFKMMG